jgi:hypothetical protein
MNQRNIIHIALMCDMLHEFTIEHESHTFDDIDVNAHTRARITILMTSMYDTIIHNDTRDTRTTNVNALIDFVCNNIVCHDRDDDESLINDICNLIDV